MKRALLNDVFLERPKHPLYHYTTQQGLLGIIEQKKIWATHASFLNDRREFQHAVALISEEIDNLLAATSESEIRSTLQEMAEAVNGYGSMNVCVCSFSEEPDSLSQWRAYGGATSGFAIGFNADFLAAATKKLQWYLAKCIYDPGEQRKLMTALVEQVVEEILSGEAYVDKARHIPRGGNLCAYLNQYAPILKDQSFSEEREWRIISRPIMARRLEFRTGTSTLVPYYTIPLDYEDLPLSLHEVVIGPTPHEQISSLAVRNLLVHHHFRDVPVPVVISKVPFRNW